MTVKNKTFFYFNESYLLQFTSKLDLKDHENVAVKFAENLIENNKETALLYLHQMTIHPNPFFRYQAARLLEKIPDKSSIPYLESLLNQHIQPETKMTIDFQGFGNSSKTAYTIAKMAEIALNQIKNN